MVTPCIPYFVAHTSQSGFAGFVTGQALHTTSSDKRILTDVSGHFRHFSAKAAQMRTTGVQKCQTG
jgi:hypothetical protein